MRKLKEKGKELKEGANGKVRTARNAEVKDGKGWIEWGWKIWKNAEGTGETAGGVRTIEKEVYNT